MEISDKVTNLNDEPVVQCDIPVVKITFLDDGDIQKVTKNFDRTASCTVAGTNFVYSFSFLGN